MAQFNFYPFTIINGREPENYQVHQSVSGCKITIMVVAEYGECGLSISEKWQYIFQIYSPPAHNTTGYEIRLFQFERNSI